MPPCHRAAAAFAWNRIGKFRHLTFFFFAAVRLRFDDVQAAIDHPTHQLCSLVIIGKRREYPAAESDQGNLFAGIAERKVWELRQLGYN